MATSAKVMVIQRDRRALAGSWGFVAAKLCTDTEQLPSQLHIVCALPPRTVWKIVYEGRERLTSPRSFRAAPRATLDPRSRETARCRLTKDPGRNAGMRRLNPEIGALHKSRALRSIHAPPRPMPAPPPFKLTV